jgi:hypothetical protein
VSDGGAIQAGSAASRNRWLKVGDLRELHVEESGDPRGLSIVVPSHAGLAGSTAQALRAATDRLRDALASAAA